MTDTPDDQRRRMRQQAFKRTMDMAGRHGPQTGSDGVNAVTPGNIRTLLGLANPASSSRASALAGVRPAAIRLQMASHPDK